MSIQAFKKQAEELQAKYPSKFVKESFDFINKVLSIDTCELSIPTIRRDSYKALLSKGDKKGFTVLFEGINEFPQLAMDKDWLQSEMTIEKNEINLKLTNVHVRGTTSNFNLTRAEGERYFNGSLKTDMHVERFSLKANEKSFYRQILKISSFDVTRFLKTEPLNIIGYFFSDALFRFKINNIPFSLFTTKFDGSNYLIIDCGEKVEFEFFKNHSYSVCVALGFITCNFFQNECWYIEAVDVDFKSVRNINYSELRDSMRALYNPIHQNPHAYFDGNLPDNIPNNLTVIDERVFSKLCSEICTNDKLLGALIIFMEAHKLSIYSRGASYSVTLEMLTQMIADKNAGFKPIMNDIIANGLKKEIQDVLKRYEKQIIDKTENPKADFIDSLSILRKKIEGLNSPTNKDKLTIPFQLYNIDIVPGSEEDKAIGHRNSFLHGNDLRKTKHDYLTEYEVWGVTLQFLNLINKLILKYIGYEGYTINYAEYNLNHENLDANRLFVKI